MKLPYKTTEEVHQAFLSHFLKRDHQLIEPSNHSQERSYPYVHQLGHGSDYALFHRPGEASIPASDECAGLHQVRGR